jgi:hypothetical protein
MVKKILLVTFILISVKLFAQTPKLSNFRVEDSQKSRVYFDSNVPLTGSSTTGFIISGKSISGLTINSGQLTGHYFRVSSAFTWWDNNTIRYSTGSDLGIHQMDLQYITNNIIEPTAATTRYVNDSATGSGDGTSDGSAWTISQANAATPGTTVWIKAGNYTTTIRPTNTGASAASPIKYIGYTTTIGDNPNLNWSHANPTLNSAVMPLITGAGGTSSQCLDLNVDYVIFKNIMVTNASQGVYLKGSYLHFDNVISANTSNNSSSAPFYGTGDSGSHRRIINSVAHNGGIALVRVYGTFNLFDNMQLISDANRGGDYSMSPRGSNNIFRNIFIQKFGYGSHGLILKSGMTPTEYNLIEDCEISGYPRAIEARHHLVKYNVWRNIKIRGNYGAVSTTASRPIEHFRGGGIFMYNGASFNTFDNIVVNMTSVGVQVLTSGENNNQAPDAGHDNIYKNCVFNGQFALGTRAIGLQLRQDSEGTNRSYFDNKFINCTFYNIYEITNLGGSMQGDNNEFINCAFDTHTKIYTADTTTFKYTNSNFYNATITLPVGTKVTSHPSLFVDAANGDFNLTALSMLKDIGKDVGNSDGVNYDILGIERISGSYSIGAYEDSIPLIGSVGPDTSICLGESTTLVASGGTTYQWSTGETTANLTVSPTITTTYSVTITDGSGSSNTHNVVVSVYEAPSVDLGPDQSICYDESVTLTANGVGDFLWNTGETTSSITVNPTTTTTYSVTASNACSDAVTDDVIINVNPEIGLTVGNDVSICTGESTTLTATGNGDFLWNTGETTPSITVQPNSTTTYTVSSSLGNCTENASVIVTISDSSSVDLGPDKFICFGETVTLTATGSGNFLWNTGETTSSITVNPTVTTTYSVTASNSCSADSTDDIIVIVNDLPSVNAGVDVTILNGENTTLTATGTGSFLWSTGETSPSITVNPTSTTTYSVVVTSDQGCLNQDTVVVTVENTESVVADAGQDQNVCPDSSETVLTASGGDSYLWSTGETTTSITVSPTVTTVYTVAVYVGNTHSIDDVTVNIDESCSDNIVVQKELKLYPNPTNGVINIEMSGVKGDLNVSFFNLNGSMVHTENMNNSSKAKVLKSQINLFRLAKGMYIVKLSNENAVVIKKLMVI